MRSSVSEMALVGKMLDEHRPRLVAAVSRRIDPALAVRIDPEDVVNEAFLQARRKYANFKIQTGYSAYTWLYRIALDCLIEAWRRETRCRRDLQRDMPWPAESSAQLGAGLIHPGTSPSEAVARQQTQKRVRQVLDMLREKDREILWMRHFDQLTHKEAGEVIGLTESAATLRYVRALERLRKIWNHVYGAPGIE